MQPQFTYTNRVDNYCNADTPGTGAVKLRLQEWAESLA